jgi:hypothetical protein
MIAQSTLARQPVSCPRGCGCHLQRVTAGGKLKGSPALVCPNPKGCLGPLASDKLQVAA